MKREEDIYDMGNTDYPAIQFIFENGGVVITRELSWDAGGEDVCNAFYTALSYFFNPIDIFNAMKVFGDKKTIEIKDNFFNPSDITIYSPSRIAFKAGADRGNMEIKLESRHTILNLCKAFYTLCIGLTFESESVYEMIREFADYNLLQLKEETTDNSDNKN